MDNSTGEQFIESSSTLEIANAVKQQLSILRNIESNLTKKRILAESVDEWQNMALIMDRVFLIFFALVSFISTLTFLMNSYLHEYE
jgi:hypothetical protein